MIAAILSLLAGWFRYAWWTPAAIFAVLSPLLLLKYGSVNSWRGEAGLQTYDGLDFAISAAASLAAHYVAYGIGRGAARLIRRGGARSSASTPSPRP